VARRRVALAALLLSPRRQWPAIVAAIFVAGNAAHLISGRPFGLSLGYLTANVVESFCCAWMISRWCGPEVRFGRVREVLALIAAAVFVNAGSGVIGGATGALTDRSPFAELWLTWWVVDGLGILLVTPLIITWRDVHDLFHGLRWPQVLECVMLVAV
jgi:integral membrane sensor domain MASE1